MSSNNINTFESVKIWNQRCGKVASGIASDKYWKQLAQQVERIQEELDETKLAIENRDIVEVLDGGIDLDVTVSGFNYLHQLPYQEALKAVLDNNDLKYTTNIDEAADTLTHYDSKGIMCDIVETKIDGVTYYAIHRNFDGKIMKFIDHPKVDLQPLLVKVV